MASNASKFKWKRVRITPAEAILKQKFDTTQELKEQMNSKVPTAEE